MAGRANTSPALDVDALPCEHRLNYTTSGLYRSQPAHLFPPKVSADSLMTINNAGNPPAGTPANWRELASPRTGGSGSQLPPEWKVGDTLTARVQALLPAATNEAAGQTAPQSRLILDIGGRLLEVQANLAQLRPGDRLSVTFQPNQQLLIQTKDSAPLLVSALKALLPQSLLNASATPAATRPVADALNRVMPMQGRLLDSLARLLSATTPDGSPKLAQALQQLQQAIPQQNQVVTGEGLKQALRQSGAFSEARLLAATPPGEPPRSPDLKQALLQLFLALSRPGGAPNATSPPSPPAQPWQPPSDLVAQPLQFPHPHFLGAKPAPEKAETWSTGELLKIVAQALARIQTTQLNSIQQQADPDGPILNTWLIELPVMAPPQLNLFQVRIDEEQARTPSGKSKSKPESVWRITLSFDLEPLGPLYSLVRLQRGKVSSTFWSERGDIRDLLERELPHLRQALTKLGLDVESLEALQGQPSFTQTKLETHLIDVRT